MCSFPFYTLKDRNVDCNTMWLPMQTDMGKGYRTAKFGTQIDFTYGIVHKIFFDIFCNNIDDACYI